jgi:hypothetical protein
VDVLKRLLILAFSFAALAQPQTRPFTGAEQPEMTAGKLTRQGPLLRGTGGVDAKFGPLVLHADEGSLNAETGELDLSGHVHATLPARTDHSLFRYGSGALVTGKPVDLSADHVNLKNGLLRGAGHVEIRTVEARLQAGEIEMFLSTADARLTGIVDATSPQRRRGFPEFPADIIK